MIAAVVLIGALLLFLAWRQNLFANWTSENLRAFIESFGPWAIIVFILLMAINTMTVMPPTFILMIMSGVLFGPFMGSIALWIGLLIGSVAAFTFARLMAQDYISARIGGRAARFNERLMENGFSVVLVARLLGLPPYEVVNYASGLSKITFKDFLLASMLGSIPGAIIFAITGDRLLNPDLKDPLLYIIPVTFVITFIITRLVARRKNSKQPPSSETL